MNALRRAAQRALSTGERSRLFGASRAFAAKANACPHDPAKPYHKSPLPLEAAGGLLEYSVVYTDRAMNHMSKPFCKIMNDIDATLKEAYNATSTIVMPGSGSYGMEAVARQWATGKKVLVLRNGYFSYRWTDIFEQTGIPSETIVMRGQPTDNSATPQFAPHDVDERSASKRIRGNLERRVERRRSLTPSPARTGMTSRHLLTSRSAKWARPL